MKYDIGDIVVLKEDNKKEQYKIVGDAGKSKGPMRQFAECDTYHVIDRRGVQWTFRGDSLIAFVPISREDYVHACDDVLEEVLRAKTMFKTNFQNQHEGYAVILEELDELWQEVKKNQKNYDIAAQRKEAIQCAAMCIRFITELT